MTFNFNVSGITPSDSQGGGGTAFVETLAPKNSAGLCFWLDGQCNTRKGNDHTKTYLENLVYNTPQNPDWGTSEYLYNGDGNSWVGDFLKLGNYAFYPYCVYPEMTIEALVKIDTVTLANQISIFHSSRNGGYILSVNKNDNIIYFTISDKNNVGDAVQAGTIEANKEYYLVGKIKQGDSFSLENIGLHPVDAKPLSTFYEPTETIESGVGTPNSLSLNSSHRADYEGLQIGMIRIWNRVLTDEEIQRNYQDVKRRFNF